MKWAAAVILCAVAVSACGNPTENPAALYQTGQAAYDRNDYEAALKDFRKAAEQGNASAQCYLGLMYKRGQCVALDNTEAAKWLRKAAEQGHSGAQIILGVMYSKGEGVPQDYVVAHMWLNLVIAKQPHGPGKSYSELRDAWERQMTKEQIAEAQRLSQEWKPKKQM
jgi:TPR repeat protein